MKRTIVHLIDDVTQKPATRTVTFAFDGKAYEIDVSEQTYERMSKAIAPFAAKARRAKIGSSGRASKPRTGTGTGGSS